MPFRVAVVNNDESDFSENSYDSFGAYLPWRLKLADMFYISISLHVLS